MWTLVFALVGAMSLVLILAAVALQDRAVS